MRVKKRIPARILKREGVMVVDEVVVRESAVKIGGIIRTEIERPQETDLLMILLVGIAEKAGIEREVQIGEVGDNYFACAHLINIIRYY